MKAKDSYVTDTTEYQEKFREQSRVQQEVISIIKDQYRKVNEIFTRKTTSMKERLEKDSKKLNANESRRKLELEGYAADLQSMKRKIEFYKKYITKLKALVEDDQGVADLFDKLKEEEQDDVIQEQPHEESLGDTPQLNRQ